MSRPAVRVTDDITDTQLVLLRDLRAALDDAGIGWWLFGGWGLDARIGRPTRRHGDIELWVERNDGDRTRDAVISIGADVLDTQPPEESREFTRDEIVFSSAFFGRRSDGSIELRGRWSDWHLPADSFDAPPGRLDDLVVPAMSLPGMLAMKEQFPTLRNGRPRRDKDVRDIATLRGLIGDA